MAVSYEFGNVAYSQNQDYFNGKNWADYVDYTDLLKSDLEYFDNVPFVAVFVKNDDYLIKIIDESSFEVYQLTENGDNIFKIENGTDFDDAVASELSDLCYTLMVANND